MAPHGEWSFKTNHTKTGTLQRESNALAWRRIARTTKTIPTGEIDAEILLMFSVLIIIIIIIIKYISIIYQDCTQVPRPMDEHTFYNEYKVILHAFYSSLDRFKLEDQLFAAQWIWWLASIIQFTEIWIYYRYYKIFPSDCIKNCKITPLNMVTESFVLDSDIPNIQLDSDMECCSILVTKETSEARSILPATRKTRYGKVVKSVNLSNKELRKRYAGRNKRQLQEIWAPLSKDGLIW